MTLTEFSNAFSSTPLPIVPSTKPDRRPLNLPLANDHQVNVGRAVGSSA